MTGGQQHEGGLTVDMIARQVRAEGVERIALVTDEPDKYPSHHPVAVGHDHRTIATISSACSASSPRCPASRC